MTTNRFFWITFDVRSLLPSNWQEQILFVARTYAHRKILVARHSTSREALNDDYRLPTQSVGGEDVSLHLPWLRQMYEQEFLALAQQTTNEPVSIMSDIRFGVVLNVQTGSERYECHVDTNPIEGLLFVTTHRQGNGGELIVSTLGQAQSVKEVDSDATIIEPKSGYLTFFDARHHSHYVSALKDPKDIRVVVGMNYYVPSWSEENRPTDLNTHLSGLNEGVEEK